MGCLDIKSSSWHVYIMIKTQVQILDEGFHRAQQLGAGKERSFVGGVRRGPEQTIQINPPGRKPSSDRHRPKPVAMGLPLVSEEDWTPLNHEDLPR